MSSATGISSAREYFRSGRARSAMLPPGAEFGLELDSIENQVRSIAARTSFIEAVARKRSASLLFAGAISGLLGFLFAFLIGAISTYGHYDINGNKYASGRSYFPSTVSEMVHDPNKPAGKVFFAFCFVGAVMIFQSWYPMQLRNVYIGDDAQACGISWVTWRQFIPAPGMMMLSIITVVPAAKATITDEFCVGLHLIGAAMLFVGYFICEAHTVGWGPFHGVLAKRKLKASGRGRCQRKFCLTGIGLFYLIFCVIQVVLVSPLIDPKDNDEWGELPGQKGIHLINTAGWKVKSLKMASYGSEVICGMFLIASHLVIWYNSEERWYDLPEELAALSTHMQGEESEQNSDDEASDEESDGSE